MGINLNVKKLTMNMKNWNRYSILFLFTCFVTLGSSLDSYSQEKTSSDIKKSKTITTIGGIKYYMHTVEKGQTLYAIAKSYDMSLNDIVIENPESIDGIKAGQI